MDRLASTIIHLRIPIILVTLLVTVWLGSYIPGIKFDSSSKGSIPHGDPEHAFFKETIETFGNDQVSVVVVDLPEEGGIFNRSTLEKIDRITGTIRKLEGVEDVISLMNARYLTGAEELLHTPRVIPAIPEDQEEMDELREFVLGNDLFLKTLVSSDGQAAAINIFVHDYPDSELIALDIDGKIKKILDEERDPENLHYAGMTYTRRVIISTMHRDLQVFVPLTLALITIVLLLTFRSFRGVILPLLTVAISTICTMGILGVIDKPMSLVMTILPPLLIAIGSSYSIHVVTHFNNYLREGHDNRESALLALQDLLFPMSMTAFTTVVGFGSLAVNKIPNISSMGFFAVVGIAITFIIAVTLLPSILSLMKIRVKLARKGSSADRIDGLLGWLAGFNERRRVWVATITVLVVGISLWGLLTVKIDTNFHEYFDEKSEIRQTTEIISEKLAGASTFFLVVDGKDPDSMKRPELLKSVDRIQQYMEELPGVDKTVSIVGHVKRLHSALNYDDPDSLIVPADEGIIEEELLLFSISNDPAAIERYVNGDFSQMTVFARTNLIGSSEILEALEKISDYAKKELPPGYIAKPTGTAVVLTYATEAVARGQRDSLVLALVIIFIVMTILFRSLRIGLLSMVPNAIPILLVFGMMGWSGTTLNVGTSIIACMAIGISVDDTIHFMTHFGRRMRKEGDRKRAAEDSVRAVGRPLIYTSLTLFFGFLILSLSDFKMISSVGFLTGTTMLTALGADLVLLPMILISSKSIDRYGAQRRKGKTKGGRSK
jgi:predicted RND superfamily exporter protein